MSLRVWLPLNGDLRNLGASDIEVINNSAIVDNNGKIGKCIKISNETNTNYIPNFNTTELSFGGWFKFNKTEINNIISSYNYTSSATTPTGNLFGNTSYGGIGLIWQTNNMYSSNNFSSLYIYSTLRTATVNQITAGHTITFDTWTHIMLTWSPQTHILKLYINGVSIGSKTLANFTDGVSRSLRLNYKAIFGGNGPAFNIPFYINDIRIYDHCLSPLEVKEIAQGLVLHYKLDSIKIKNGTNLVTKVTAGGRTTVLTDGRIGVQTTGENADTYFTVNLSESITNGTKYFLSCDASGISEGAFWGFPLGAQNNSSLPFKIYNGHNEYLFTANDINWGSNRLFLDDINRSDWANKATFWNFELYKVPILEIEDNSGYGHNATLTNGLLTTNVSRYSTALNLDASTKAIGNPIFEAGTFIPEYTWTGWINRNYTDAASKQIHANIASIGLYTDFTPYFSWTSGKTDGTTTGNGAAGGTATATLNKWIHMAITYKDGIGKFYINGELIKTFNYSSYGVYIAAAANNTLGNGFIGNLSDIRIYVTQLLDKDIKLLYNSSMRLDNLGNCHTYELNENKVNLMWRPENARATGKGFNNGEGLSAYTQPNCQVTCNSDGYKIYRPANLTVADNGNTMYGGLKIRNSTNGGVHIYDATIDNIFNLQKGHTYIWIFTVNGSTENASGFQLTNNMGWSGGGLNPTPSNVTSRGTGSNFNGTQECWYKFTINDDIVKTCTSSYSAFVQGNQYLSYMDFGFYFSYQSTGTGTNLYISNIRLYDITNIQQKLNKTGIANFTSFIEENYNNKILSDGEFYGQEFIEI